MFGKSKRRAAETQDSILVELVNIRRLLGALGGMVGTIETRVGGIQQVAADRDLTRGMTIADRHQLADQLAATPALKPPEPRPDDGADVVSWAFADLRGQYNGTCVDGCVRPHPHPGQSPSFNAMLA